MVLCKDLSKVLVVRCRVGGLASKASLISQAKGSDNLELGAFLKELFKVQLDYSLNQSPEQWTLSSKHQKE